MKSFKYLHTAAMAAVIAFASCTQKDNREPGTPVIFGVSTAGNEVPVTKVEYSGVVSEGYERINWEPNDRISIYGGCRESANPANEGAEYKISSIFQELGRFSKARIVPAGNSWLTWGEDNVHYFYGIFPKVTSPASSPEVNKIIRAQLESAGAMMTFFARIPRSQELKSEPLMYAYTSARKNSGNPVNLDFKPAVNTFDIELVNGRMEPIQLRSVGLESPTQALSGEFNIIITAGPEAAAEYIMTPNIYGDVQRTYSNGLTIGSQARETVRIYTMPQDINDLTLVLKETNDRISKLPLKNNTEWINFSKEKKYKLNNIEIR